MKRKIIIVSAIGITYRHPINIRNEYLYYRRRYLLDRIQYAFRYYER